eukprot:SAG31_NODE_223_length_19859_cov_14.949899_12_plen_47_part_00
MEKGNDSTEYELLRLETVGLSRSASALGSEYPDTVCFLKNVHVPRY